MQMVKMEELHIKIPAYIGEQIDTVTIYTGITKQALVVQLLNKFFKQANINGLEKEFIQNDSIN